VKNENHVAMDRCVFASLNYAFSGCNLAIKMIWFDEVALKMLEFLSSLNVKSFLLVSYPTPLMSLDLCFEGTK